ncbi:MAG TPA: hypothetical protein VJ579_00960 [Candidatus Paceibacterota bacterium]|nr:hypothetical protein [Candidatus Paceibacterota bacterium]
MQITISNAGMSATTGLYMILIIVLIIAFVGMKAYFESRMKDMPLSASKKKMVRRERFATVALASLIGIVFLKVLLA